MSSCDDRTYTRTKKILRPSHLLPFLLSLTHYGTAFAQVLDAPPAAGETISTKGRAEMNGITFKDYQGFEKNWKLVTVRFRKDTNEMRFVYANPAAWKTLSEGKTDYPDGAVFSKIGLATSDDPAFASSVVPSGSRRFQFMVRDKKKYADTGGWGYGLFNSLGLGDPGDPKSNAQACFACHNIVADRNYVFSVPADINTDVHESITQKLQGSNSISFRDGNRGELPPDVTRNIPSKIWAVRFLSGKIQENLFQGTLDEIRPTLANEVFRSGQPTALVSPDKKSYIIVFKSVIDTKCKAEGTTDMRAVSTNPAGFGPQVQDQSKESLPVSVSNFCWK